MKKTSKIISLILVLIIVVTSITACSGGDSDTIKIAVAGPQTGDYAEYGNGFKNAVELMVEKWNEDGGVLDKEIEVVVYDDKNSGEEAATIAEKVASDDDIVGVIGHFASGVCMAASPTYQEMGIVNISPSASHPDYTLEGDYIFRNNTIISIEAQAGVDIATEILGKEKIGILSVKTDWGTNTAQITKEIIEDSGATVVDHQEVVDGTVDFSPNISKLEEAGAEVVIVAAMYNTLAPFASQYREIDSDIEFVGFSNAYSQQLIDLAKEDAENIHFPTQFFDQSEEPKVKNFVEEYNERFGANPSSLTAQAYDSAGLLLTAIENAGSAENEEIRDELATIEYEGVTGLTKFDENRNSVRPFTVVKIENGEFVEVK